MQIKGRSQNPDPAVHRQFPKAPRKEVSSPSIKSNIERQPTFPDQHCDFPKADGRHCQAIASKGVVRGGAAIRAELGAIVVQPHQHVRIQHDQWSASQGSSSGETMSPRIRTEPLCRPAKLARLRP